MRPNGPLSVSLPEPRPATSVSPAFDREHDACDRDLLLTSGPVDRNWLQNCGGDTPAEKRADADRMAREALDRLYRTQPSAKGHVENAAGYGVFSNVGSKIFLLATGNGFGVVVDNKSGKRTYMRMAEVGVGVGLGVKDFRAVFVFDSKNVMNTFVNDGWDFGGDADAAATHQGEGAALAQGISVAPGIHLYQMTETGLALSATLAGTKYWKDEELNER